MKKILFAYLFIVCFSLSVSAHVPLRILVQITRAEDELRFDKTLEDLIKNADAHIRTRAALAAGRIGDEKAIPALADLLENDKDNDVRVMAAFALGETESAKAADAIVNIMNNLRENPAIRARAIEAAGKIAAANAKDEKSKTLGEAILNNLDFEAKKRSGPFLNVIEFGLTAVLRARPANAEKLVIEFTEAYTPQIRANALNTLARLRSKNAGKNARQLLEKDEAATVRANAARVLGAAEDMDSFEMLLNAAVSDKDLRVRVSAIRALGSLKDAKAAGKLLERADKLFGDYKNSKFANPSEKSEILELVTTFGRILPNSNNEKAVKFLRDFREADKFGSPETEIAFAQIAPNVYVNLPTFNVPQDSGFGFGFFSAAGVTYYAEKYPKSLSGFAQGFGAIAENQSADKETVKKAQKYISLLTEGLQAAMFFSNPEVQWNMGGDSLKEMPQEMKAKYKEEFEKFETLKKDWIGSFPDILRALAKLKPEKYEKEIASFLINKSVYIGPAKNGKNRAGVLSELSDDPVFYEKKEIIYNFLHKDPIVRATAAELMSEIKDVDSSPALLSAFNFAVSEDKEINDAQLAILDAIIKQDRETAKKVFAKALNSPDYLVRKRAADLIKQNDLIKDFPTAEKQFGMLKPYDPKTGTKLGQILNSEADYVRAVSRENGTVKAIFTTEKGNFTIDLTPEDAPLTVDNFIKLARSKYFNGVSVHRVVPNFVMQDGDPRGDGNGGPGWQIRCEINMLEFDRGAVGMALSGKDTGGSQWFVTHSSQPHLDGGYTVFGRVNENDLKIVDSIVRGDKILSVKIVEEISKRKTVTKE